MKIINLTQNTVLAEDIIVADTIFGRIKGLLGKEQLKRGQAIILKPCNSMHTFFMHFPVDVLFVNKENKVIRLIPRMLPFRLSPVFFSASFAIEFPSGTIQASQTNIDDLIIVQE